MWLSMQAVSVGLQACVRVCVCVCFCARLCVYMSLCVCVRACARAYLGGSLGDGLVAEGLQGLHGGVVAGGLARASLANELIGPHRQLHVEDLGDGVVVPGEGGPRLEGLRGWTLKTCILCAFKNKHKI